MEISIENRKYGPRISPFDFGVLFIQYKKIIGVDSQTEKMDYGSV